MAESTQIKDNGQAKRPTTEKHGTEPPNVTIAEMKDNLFEYLESKWEGPFQVILVTNAAVKVSGKNKWIHVFQRMNKDIQRLDYTGHLDENS